MAEVDIAPNFGGELKDGFRPVNAWVGQGIAWLEDIQTFYRERSTIEKEYSQKLSALAKKYYERKSKKSSTLSVGDTPTVTPGSLESASMTTWGTQLSTLESRATEHERFSNQLISSLADPLKILQSRYEELQKHHSDYAARLEKERDNTYTDLKKTKGKYDSVCQDVENRRKKIDNSYDHGKTKAQSAFQQQQQDMRNVKNTYLITINVTNKQKERYYHEYVPDLLDSLQDLSETRITKLNALWSTAAALETQTLTRSTELVTHLASEIPRNNPVLDSMMFARHNASNWQDLADFSFEPSPVWLDDGGMATDEASKTFLRNIMMKSKGSLGDTRRECERLRKEVEGAKRVRQLIRDGKDKRDEVDIVRAQFSLQVSLHEVERRKITSEVEVTTIAGAVGDISVGARNHAFKSQTFKIPTNCDLCGERIWGLSAKGFDCKECGFTCHSKCEMKVPADCPGEVDKAAQKKLKAERQTAAQSSSSQPASAVNGSGDGVGDMPRLSRSDTIGSMNTLSSGYAASAQRSVSGTVSKPAEETGGAKIVSSGSTRRSRIVAPPPDHYIGEGNSNGSLSRDDGDKAKMMYAFQATGAGEVSVEEGAEVLVLEPDDGSGWMKVRVPNTGASGLVPASYADIIPVSAATSPTYPSAATTASASTTSLAGSISSSGTAGPSGKKKGPTVAPKRGGKKIKHVEALYTYNAGGEGEVSMDEGERLVLLSPDQGDGWCEVERAGGQGKGVVPAGWVREV